MSSHLTLHVRKYFLTGLLTVLPLLITLLVVKFLFRMIGGLFSPVLLRFFPETPIWLKYAISFAVLLAFLYGLGLLTGHFLGRWFWGRFESVLLKIPLLRSVYSASREVVQIFSRPEKNGFREVVFVEFPRPGMKVIGFLTGTLQDEFGHLYFKIFIPTTPNPTTGFLEIVEASSVVRSGLSVEEGIRIIMSGGILGPEMMNLHAPDDTRNLAACASCMASAPGKDGL